MELDDKMIMELASQMGLTNGKKIDMNKVKAYENKSDSEIKREISKLKDQLKANDVSYDKQLAAVKSLMPMMDGKQKARLMEIIKLLES
ncbi:MAG: hypothetical protein PHH48_02660 [Eubacteriales bacterium]|nr:hypothetical protein [Eubacteriales bacterium]